MTKAQQIGRRIAQARRKKGVRDDTDVRPVDVARALGVSQPTVSEWESGVSTPKPDKMERLADYLGVTPEFLLWGREAAAPHRRDAVPSNGTVNLPGEYEEPAHLAMARIEAERATEAIERAGEGEEMQAHRKARERDPAPAKKPTRKRGGRR